MIDHETPDSLPIIERFGVSIGTLVLIVVQTVAVVAWLANDHAQIIHTVEVNGKQEQRLDNIDINGTRAAGVVAQRITQIEVGVVANNRQLDTLAKRIDD